MKLTYTTGNGRMSAEISGDDQRSLFAGISDFQEVFENSVCGKCGGDSIRFVVRNVEENDFYELRCQDLGCRARLSFGCNKKGGGLFPKRKDGEKWLPDGGWVKWDAAKGENV